jgi:hypothetical protein
MDSSVSPKDEIFFLRVCRHISNAVYVWGKKEIHAEFWWGDLKESATLEDYYKMNLKEIRWKRLDYIDLV